MEFRDLALAHKGKVICVMGGADCLADDLKTVKADVFISCNGHGADLVAPNYLLAMDEINKPTQRDMGEHLRSLSDAPIISPHAYSDHRLSNWPQHPRFVLTGMIGAWVAMMLGAKAVVLAGMDAYGGDEGYVGEARKIARDVHVPVRVVSGPLADVWQAYDHKEKFGRYSAPSQIDGWLGSGGEIEVEVLKPTSIPGRDLRAGERLRVMRHEVAKLIRHRMLREV